MKKLITILIFFLTFSFLNIFAQFWKKINTIPSQYSNNYWLDVFFHPSNSNYGWICGFNGMVIRTTDGGNSWRGTVVPNAYHLESIYFPTLTIGYTSGVDGIFKSTDGGASWFDITPTGARDSTTFWGCYFLNANYGILVGDGCGIGRRQHFWVTTDGGTSWSVFLGSEENSGMTDVIIYPDGSGYASSSGRIWITSDSGKIWSVFSSVGPNLWQEEITNYGNSFLVPYAGYTCTGGGNDGGMCFSTDFGFTWNRTQTGLPMFGTFLLNNLKGWACGYSKAVYYTSNGGISWTRRNCGIASGNLDDLWFINENDGWVVGEGVYKLSEPTGVAKPTSVNFGNVCIGQKALDTIWFTNYNFNDATIFLSLSTTNSDFKIESPGNAGLVQSCDSIMIIISFAPKTTDIASATLTISPPYQGQISIPILGKGIEATASLEDTLLVLPSVPCGQTFQSTINIISKNSDEEVSSIQKISGSNGIYISTLTPFQIINNRPNLITINIVLQDTGWQTAKFRLHYNPCDKEEVLTVRAYGKSPIINSDSAISKLFFCKINPIFIEIRNNGNDTLRITNFTFSPNNSALSILGWKSGRQLNPSLIEPKISDTLILTLDPNFEGELNTRLILTNNDFTTTRGIRNNHSIPLNIQVYLPKLLVSDTTIFFGKLCVGDSLKKKFIIHNKGNLDESINLFQKNLKEFTIFSTRFFPYSLLSKDSTIFFVEFKPTRPGLFIDTIKLYTRNCPDTILVFCIGEAVLHQFDYTPKQMTFRLPKGISKDFQVKFWSLFPDTLTLSEIGMQYDSSQISINTQVLFSNITDKDTGIAVVSILGNTSGKFSAIILITLSGACKQQIRIPIEILIFEKNLVISPSSFDFGTTICQSKDSTFRLQIRNEGFDPDTIQSITLVQSNDQFSFNTTLLQPLILPQNSQFDLEIKYSPKILGYDTAFVVFTFSDSSRNQSVPVFAFWGKSQFRANPVNIDFGTFEYCQSPVDSILLLWNVGNITDTLEIHKDFSNSCFISNLSNFAIGTNDTSYMQISFVPSKSYSGKIFDTLFLRSKLCKEIIPIIVSAEIEKPQFDISPSIVELGQLWIEDTIKFELELQNNSNYPLDFNFLGLVNFSPNFFPDSLPDLFLFANSKSKVLFTIIAKESGEYFDTLKYRIKSKCEYEKILIVHYNIPKENYDMVLRIGKYTFPPGETATIQITNEIPNPKLHLDSLIFTLEYDRYLFDIIECSSSWSNNLIQTSTKSGRASLTLTGEILQEFISFPSSINCYGKTFYSAPDTTSLIFTNTEYFPQKPINLRLENGFIRISPICKPVGSLRLSTLQTFAILDISSINQELNIDIFASDNLNIIFTFFDLLGNQIYSTSQTVKQGNSRIIVGLPNEVATGIYIVRISDLLTSYSILLPIY